MNSLFSPEILQAASQLVIVLDEHRFGAALFVLTVALISLNRALPKKAFK